MKESKASIFEHGWRDMDRKHTFNIGCFLVALLALVALARATASEGLTDLSEHGLESRESHLDWGRLSLLHVQAEPVRASIDPSENEYNLIA